MNTIGKILVILNLVFALLVGGFLVIDFATRSNWKTAYESLKREMSVAQGNYNISGKTMQDINTQVKRAEGEKEDLRQKLVEQETIAKARYNSLQLQYLDAVDKAKDADLNLQKAIAEKSRLKDENKDLTATLQNRDAMIQTLQKENKDYRTKAIAFENTAKATQQRNENLLSLVQEYERKAALREAGAKEGDLNRDPNAPNPPSTYVKGTIEKVDPLDRTLVQISLGSDQGLKRNNTLEVYRLSPEPQYLGMIRIVDAKEHVAVGKLVRNGLSGNRGALQVGDIVASSVQKQ